MLIIFLAALLYGNYHLYTVVVRVVIFAGWAGFRPIKNPTHGFWALDLRTQNPAHNPWVL
jgi:pantothenate kinase-related protein Tda10